jgi:hypothetical protein
MHPPSTVQNWMLDDDGQVSLDLNEKTTVALTKIIDDYIEAGTIKQDNFNEFTIPITKKNRILFGPVGNPSALNVNNTKVFMIQLIADSVSYPATGLEIVEANDKEKQYSCTIFGEINDWYRPLSQMRLNDLDLGSDIVDFNFIIDQNANSIYDENLAPVVAPLVNYGKWFINTNKPIYSEVPAQVVFNNLRFWFHPYALVKQALCQVGYKLIAPYFDTEAKRKHWSYLLDLDFETANQLDVANRSFLVNPNATIFFNVLFETRASGAQYNGVFFRVGATSDPGNHYFTRVAGGSFPLQDYYGSFYSGGMIGTFSFIGTVNLTPTNAPSLIIPVAPTFINLRVSIKKAPKFGILGQDVLLNNATTLATKEYVYKSSIINGVSLDFDFNLVTDRIKVYQHEVVFVHVEYDAELVDTAGNLLDESFLIDDTVILPGLEFKNNVELQVIEEGDTIEFGKLLRKDKSPIELIAGLAHLDDLKLESDVINKTISMYPEFKVDLGGTDGVQEGFFLENTNNAFEATPKIHANSAVQRFRNQDLGRNVYLKFKDSTDGYIQSLNLEDEPHSKKVDLGDQYKEQENKIENPFFEPTLNAFDARISGYVVQLGTNPVQTSGNYLPFMWEGAPTGDNYPDVGFDYEPRIATMQANGGQIVVLEPSITGYDTNSESIYVYEDNITFFQLIFGQIFPDAVKRKIGLGPTVVSLTDTIVYGNDFVNTALLDQYQVIYQRAIKQAYFGVVLEFLVDIDLLDFANLSFRRKWHIKYYSGAWGEIDFYARISRVTDYVFGANILTPVEVIADNNNFICE